MTYEEFRAAVLARVAALVAPETVVYANQNAPAPATPYWTLLFLPVRNIGSEHYAEPDAAGVQKVVGVREVTVRVQRYGDGSFPACSTLNDKLAMTTVLEEFWKLGISLYNKSGPQDVTVKLDNARFQDRGVLDVFLRVNSVIEDNVGLIETVEVAGQIETVNVGGGFDANPDLAITGTIVL